MAKILVVGSVAIDNVESPYGKREECFGGSATYFSYAASFFAPVKLVAVIGDDFPENFRQILNERDIDLSALEVAQGKTFRWKGKYSGDMNVAETLATELNVFEKFRPKVDDTEADFLFLANIDPELQLDVLKKVKVKNLVASDTMNLWINIKKDELIGVLSGVDLFVLNDMEARLLSSEDNLIKALDEISSYGPSKVVIKKGEHGAVAKFNNDVFALPAYPVNSVFDPTGAGDSFAGGMIGYLASVDADIDLELFKKGVAYGVVTASFTVEDFSLEKLRKICRQDIENRLVDYKNMLTF